MLIRLDKKRVKGDKKEMGCSVMKNEERAI